MFAYLQSWGSTNSMSMSSTVWLSMFMFVTNEYTFFVKTKRPGKTYAQTVEIVKLKNNIGFDCTCKLVHIFSADKMETITVSMKLRKNFSKLKKLKDAFTLIVLHQVSQVADNYYKSSGTSWVQDWIAPCKL